MPYMLEVVTYLLAEAAADTPEFARSKPDLVTRSAQEFSGSHYGVDILKLEFPADLKWVKEFSSGAFDGKERQWVYDLSEVRELCSGLNEAAGMPWVILSAGVDIVDIQEFLVQLDLAVEAGASGFLCGQGHLEGRRPLYPDVAAMEEWPSTEGRHNFVLANAYGERALPWFRHRKFGSTGNIELVQWGPGLVCRGDLARPREPTHSRSRGATALSRVKARSPCTECRGSFIRSRSSGLRSTAKPACRGCPARHAPAGCWCSGSPGTTPSPL